MARIRKRGNSGFALVNVLFFVSILSSLVVVTDQFLDQNQNLVKNQDTRYALQSVGKSIELLLYNRDVVSSSATLSEDLANCLGEHINEDGVASKPGSCIPLKEGEVYDFDAKIPDDYLVDGESERCYKVGNACLIADSKGLVGYNIRGEVGAFSEQFPIQAKTFFYPSCPVPLVHSSSDLLKPCDYADKINLGYKLTYHNFKGGKPSQILMFYPKKRYFNSVQVGTLITQKCNTGAVVVGYDEDGSIECECQKPYIATGSRDKRGVTCVHHNVTCPGSQVKLGLDSEGKPICSDLATTNVTSWNETACFGTMGACKGSAQPHINCAKRNGQDVSGWLADFDMTCSSQAQYVVKNGRDIDWVRIVVGALGAAGGFFLANQIFVLKHLLSFISPFGSLNTAILLALAVATAIFWITTIFEWHLSLESDNRCNDGRSGDCPVVSCEVRAVCRSFQ